MSDNKHVKAFQEKHAKAGESIASWGEGYIGEMMGKGKDTQHNGVLLVTGERVVFYRKGIFGEVIESIPLKAITSIERKSLLGHRTVRLHTSHDDLTFKTFKKEDEAALVAAIEAGRSAPSSTDPVGVGLPQPTPTPSPLEAIRQLGDLKAAGLLTEAEFESKKAALLSRI